MSICLSSQSVWPLAAPECRRDFGESGEGMCAGAHGLKERSGSDQVIDISTGIGIGHWIQLVVPKCCHHCVALQAPLPCLRLAPQSPLGQRGHWDASRPPLPPAAPTHGAQPAAQAAQAAGHWQGWD